MMIRRVTSGYAINITLMLPTFTDRKLKTSDIVAHLWRKCHILRVENNKGGGAAEEAC